MIPETTKQRLRDNWGEKADAMECYCEIKFMSENPRWECYIYALDPDNNDSIACIIPEGSQLLWEWSLKELNQAYDRQGENFWIDEEFRRIKASTLYRKLQGRI